MTGSNSLFGLRAVGLGCLFAAALMAAAQEAPSATAAPQVRAEPPLNRQGPSPVPMAPLSSYDKSLFLNPVAADQLGFLKPYDGAPAKNLWRDKQFRKLLKNFVPGCMFHYGADMPLDEALDLVMKDSLVAVTVRSGRYLVVSGLGGPYLGGRGFVWVDLQDGVGLGGFYFHPTNGEPTPTLAVFGRQVKETQLAMSDLPPAFDDDLIQWATVSRVPPVETRYFLTGGNKRVLLEHDEDYCATRDGSLAGDECRQMDADAADADETAAYYLDQVHYATNATAWMIGADQVAWIGVRDRTCGVMVDPLGCRIRVTREHTHGITGRRPSGGGHPGRR